MKKPAAGPDLLDAATLDLVANCLDIAAAVLAVLVVRSLTARQLERARLVETLPADEATPVA